MFPNLVTSALIFDSAVMHDIYRWLSCYKLKEANANGTGDYLLRYNYPPAHVSPDGGCRMVFAFKEPEKAMLFKLTWG